MKKVFILSSLILVVLFMVSRNSDAQGAGATKSNVVQSQDTEVSGITADLTECKRKDGVLSVKVQFRNTSDATVYFTVDTHHGDYAGFYVTAADKKYFVLKDTEKEPLAPKYISDNIAKGGKLLWWAKFPAPPDDIKKINLMIPKVLPFEDVPITD